MARGVIERGVEVAVVAKERRGMRKRVKKMFIVIVEEEVVVVIGGFSLCFWCVVYCYRCRGDEPCFRDLHSDAFSYPFFLEG